LGNLGKGSNAFVEGITLACWGLCGIDDLAEGHEKEYDFGEHDGGLRWRKKNPEGSSALLCISPGFDEKSGRYVYICYDDLPYF
jgi:hypothetical protein